MSRTSINCLKASIIVLLTIFAVMNAGSPARAGDPTMQTNLNDIADQMA